MKCQGDTERSWRTAGAGLGWMEKREGGGHVVDEAGGNHTWLDVGGLGFAENRAAWPGPSGLEEHEDDDGSGGRCVGRAVWDTQ